MSEDRKEVRKRGETPKKKETTGGKGERPVGGSAEEKDVRLWLMQLLLTRLFEGDFAKIKQSQQEFAQRVKLALNQVKDPKKKFIDPNLVEELTAMRANFGTALGGAADIKIGPALESMLQGKRIGDQDKRDLIKALEQKSPKKGKEAEKILKLYEEFRGLRSAKEIERVIGEGNKEFPVERFEGRGSLAEDFGDGIVAYQRALEMIATADELKALRTRYFEAGGVRGGEASSVLVEIFREQPVDPIDPNDHRRLGEALRRDILYKYALDKERRDFNWINMPAGTINIANVMNYLGDPDEIAFRKVDGRSRDLDAQKRWSNLITLANYDPAGQTVPEKLRHYRSLAESAAALSVEDGIEYMESKKRELVKTFLAALAETSDYRARQVNQFEGDEKDWEKLMMHKEAKVDWLFGQFDDEHFDEMVDVVFKRQVDRETTRGVVKRVLPANRIVTLVADLRDRRPGSELSMADMARVTELRRLLEENTNALLVPRVDRSPWLMSMVTPAGLPDVEQQRAALNHFTEHIGTMISTLKEVEGSGKVPRRWKTAAEYAREGRRREAAVEGVPLAVPQPAMPFAGGESPFGGDGRGMYGIPEEMIKRYLQVRTDLGETPAEAIERGMNTFIETGADERSLYYFQSHLSNMMAGEKGDVPQPLHLLYTAAQGHAQTYGFVANITSPEQLLQMGSRMTAGTDDDLVERKDFDMYGGLQGFKLFDATQGPPGPDGSPTGDYQANEIDKEDVKQLEHFSVGPFDVMDLLSDIHWATYFQDKGRGYDQHFKRRQVLAEAFFLNMGGEIKTMSLPDQEGKHRLERRYFIKGIENMSRVAIGRKKNRLGFWVNIMHGRQDVGLSMGELLRLKLRFGSQLKIPELTDERTLDFKYRYTNEATMEELAKAHMWMGMLGEAQWELTGRRALMDRQIKGRRNIYQWDKFFNYDIYDGTLGAHRGFPIYTKSTEKPVMDLIRKDYISNWGERMGAFLFAVKDYNRTDPKTGKAIPEFRVRGVNSILAGGDPEKGDLVKAEKFVRLMDKRFRDPHLAIKDQDLFRMAFLTEEDMRDRGFKPGDQFWRRWETARFDDKDKELIRSMRWDKLFQYLSGYKGHDEEDPNFVFWPPRITKKEIDYVFGELMHGTKIAGWNEGPEQERKKRGLAAGSEIDKWTFAGPGGKPTEVEQENAAKWFFEHFSDRYYHWGRLEQNQHLKDANYTRQAAEQAKRLMKFNEQPTADNLLEWTLPMFAFSRNDKVRQVNYDAARWNLLLLTSKRAGELWTVFDGIDHIPQIGKLGIGRGIHRFLEKYVSGPSILSEAEENGFGPIKYNGVDEYGYPKLEQRQGWKRPLETLRIWLYGAGSIKGHVALDAWAKKNYIEKLWHVGAISWVHKEALLAEFLTRLPPISGFIGHQLLAKSILLPEKLQKRYEALDKVNLLNPTKLWLRVQLEIAYAQRLAALGIAKIWRWSYLNLWIHDWGKAIGSFWNEVVAPAVGGEDAAKALQIET